MLAVLVNCTKNHPIENLNSDKNQIQNENELVSKIHKFQELANQQRDGVSLKSGDKISVDSAVYYIGTTINYTYCFPTSVYNKAIWDTTLISFPVDQQFADVLFDDALSAYNSCIDSIILKYGAISDTSKKLVGVVLQDLGTDCNYDRDIRIIAQFGTGSTLSSLLDSNMDFDEDDEFWYEDDSYRCDGTGTNGAPDILETAILFKFNTAPPPGYHVWFEPGEIYTPEYYNFVVDVTKDNYCDYRIFYAHSDINPITDETRCLDYNQDNLGIHEMDFYLNGADYIIIDWFENHNPQGKAFKTCSFTHQNTYTPNLEIKHILNFTFAIKHLTPIDPGTTGNFPIPIDN